MIWAIVPFKGGADAKSRLAADLSDADRRRLSLAMLDDVLETLSTCRALDGVLLVSRASEASHIAKTHGVEHYSDRALSLSGAVAEASSHLADSMATDGTFYIPGDLPLISQVDVVKAIEEHVEVTVIPDESRLGTNGLLCSPPNRFAYCFDGKSFFPHLGAARRTGAVPRILELVSFGLDVDSFEDALKAGAHSKNGRTANVVRSMACFDTIRSSEVSPVSLAVEPCAP